MNEYIEGKLVVAGIVNDKPDVGSIKLFDRFDDYIVIGVQYIDNIDAIVTMQCIVCGNIKQVSVCRSYNPLKFSKFVHSFKHCQENYLRFLSKTEGLHDYEYINNSLFIDDYGVKRFQARCKYCGHIISSSISNLNKLKLLHSPSTCYPEYYNQYIGKVFKDFKIIGINTTQNPITIIIECIICGAQKQVTLYNFLNTEDNDYKHSFKHCKENYCKTIKMNGDYVFDKLVEVESKNNNRIQCQIKCTKCGHTKVVQLVNLEKNTYFHGAQNCEENSHINAIGRIVDDIQIMEQVGTKEYYDKKTKWTHHYPIYKVKCLKCGIEKEMLMSNIRKHHGTKHDDFKHIISQYVSDRSDPVYRSFYTKWRNINSRCYDERNNRYELYGARGIRVCDRWRESFLNFFYDMWNSFNEAVKEYGIDNVSIDRIDVNGNYEPGNVRWATDEEQANNKRNNVIFKVYDDNTKKCIGDYIGLAQYCRDMGYDENDRCCIKNRLHGTVENTPYKGRIYVRVPTI